MKGLQQRSTRVKTAPCRVFASRDDLATGNVAYTIAPRSRAGQTTPVKRNTPTVTVAKTRLTPADHARINATITTNRVDWSDV